MRLDKLTIGSAKGSPAHQFKNLKNVTIDFDQEHWVTVVIGWNGTGKSNVLEALAIIFRDLITYKSTFPKKKKEIPRFAFKLAYRMGSGESLRHIHIDADPDRGDEPFTIHVATDAEARGEGTLIPFSEGEASVSALRGKAIKLTAFLNADNEYLPRYVFSYYSGESPRMQEVFEPYLKDYYQDLLSSKTDPAPKRLFYALPVHSQFVLLAFLIQPDQRVKDFLEKELGIDPDNGVESVLFVLREPPWESREGDPRFWHARGLVQRFLDRLMNVSLAPISIKRKLKKSIWNKNSSEYEYQYLYIKDVESLRALVGDQPANEFFRDLESTYVSELIEEVRIRVRLKKNDGSVTFRELSEGEQQLLTVLGLLRFTAEEESLFLLDEPDTHLNPRWCVDYLNYLRTFVGQSSEGQDNSHIVLTTHNPLAIAELVKEQVQILYREVGSRTVRAENPAVDPKGMGFAGIVTSDMFGLGTSLDKATNADLLTLHRLSTQQAPLSDDDQAKLVKIRTRLEGLDFNFASRDRLEQEYLRARFELAADGDIDGAVVTPENKQKALDALVQSLMRSLQEGQA
ncbi:AAA family ATPase [Acidovorax sp. SUPP1855]|uniref:ATP-binding protein n=1 Tax=Acidovorax sp. SUPP1855 TaxID=431774 RepID=UPI0023DE4B60|nr:ATP-binding protein [Acidovorax sp. SUPP1855]GKS86095.1 AAA family ATPase [Acidovorax sp. SUPP1855]